MIENYIEVIQKEGELRFLVRGNVEDFKSISKNVFSGRQEALKKALINTNQSGLVELIPEFFEFEGIFEIVFYEGPVRQKRSDLRIKLEELIKQIESLGVIIDSSCNDVSLYYSKEDRNLFSAM